MADEIEYPKPTRAFTIQNANDGGYYVQENGFRQTLTLYAGTLEECLTYIKQKFKREVK